MKGFCVLVNIWSFGFLNFRIPNQLVQKVAANSSCEFVKKLAAKLLQISRENLAAKTLTLAAKSYIMPPQPGAQKRASSEGPTHQKSYFPTHRLRFRG